MINYLRDKTPEDVVSAAENMTVKSGHQVKARDILQFIIEGEPNSAIITAARTMTHMRGFLKKAGII